jgi:hypothetical protein
MTKLKGYYDAKKMGHIVLQLNVGWSVVLSHIVCDKKTWDHIGPLP